jgi:Transcriptional regulator
MTWRLRGAPGSERLGEYEQLLEEVFGDGKITALCQYDRRHFGKGALSPLTRAHRVVVVAEAARKKVHRTQTVVDEAALRRRRGPPPLEGPSPDYLAREEQIVAAAAEVFRTKGYEAGTLEDVAEALDIGRPALYYYIRSKNHLLWLIYQRVMSVIVEAIEEVIGIQDPPSAWSPPYGSTSPPSLTTRTSSRCSSTSGRRSPATSRPRCGNSKAATCRRLPPPLRQPSRPVCCLPPTHARPP